MQPIQFREAKLTDTKHLCQSLKWFDLHCRCDLPDCCAKAETSCLALGLPSVKPLQTRTVPASLLRVDIDERSAWPPQKASWTSLFELGIGSAASCNLRVTDAVDLPRVDVAWVLAVAAAPARSLFPASIR